MNLKLVLELDDRGAIKGIRDADGNLVRLGGDGRKAGDEIAGGMSRARAGVRSISEQLGRMRREIMGLIGIRFGAEMVRDLANATDRFKEVTARLAVASRSAEDAARAYKALSAIARETRADWGATLDLYSRLARSTKELGVSQSDLLTVTKAINQAIVVSGASAQEAEAALIQFGQGMASGALRGDELRSVLEQMPRLAQMIARGMGVSLGQLRQLGAEGLLTTRDVIAAIKAQAGSVQQEFNRMPPTISQAVAQIRNSFTIWLGEQDKALGSSTMLSGALMGIADNMDIAARSAIGLSGAILTLRANAMLAARGFGRLGKAVSLVGAAFAGWEIGKALADKFAIVRDFGITLGALLNKLFINVRFLGRKIAAEFRLAITSPLDALRERVASVTKAIADGLRAVGMEAAAGRLDVLAKALHSNTQSARRYREEIARLNRERAQELALIDRGAVAMMREPMRRRQPPATASGGGSNPPAAGVDILNQLRKKQRQQDRENLRKHLAQKLSMLETSLMTEAERENQAYQNRLSILAQARELKLIDEQRQQELEAQLKEQHEQRLTEIQRQALEQRQQMLTDFQNTALGLQQGFAQAFQDASRVNLDQMLARMSAFHDASKKLWQTGFQGKVAVMKGGLAMMSGLMESHNRKQFELGKAAAIANAVISTAQGMAEALKWGFPMGPIFAGIIGGLGALQIAKIASTKFGQKGAGSAGIPSAGIGGGTPTVRVNTRTGLPASPSGLRQQQVPTVNLTVQALHPEALSPEVAQRIADSLAPALHDTLARGGQNVAVMA